MKKIFVYLIFIISVLVVFDSFAQQLPLVYNEENTGKDCPIPYLPLLSETPVVKALPDPFAWSDGRGRISNYSDWRYRRAEIKAEIENYEIGTKPNRPDLITASYSAGVLTVNVTVNGKTLTLTSQVILPDGPGPFPAVIGMNSTSGSLPSTIFSSRNIARIAFMHNQVTAYANHKNTDPYYQLYPAFNVDNSGQYSAWAWGVSRLIDGLELVKDVLPIDLQRLAVTGCSYAGKMALFAGALDERIALTISQESGGGGATSWRYSHSEPSGSVEKIDNTDYNWFKNSMKDYSGDNVWRLPHDHHELMAMVAPRALLVTANPDMVWLSNRSTHVVSKACQQVYDALGISDRFGYSIIGDHGHCSVPSNQVTEIEAFVDKFLLGKSTVNTSVTTSPYSIDLTSWITWTNPQLSNGLSFFGKSTLLSPANKLTGVDTTKLTFKWNKLKDASNYRFQLTTDPTFSVIDISDSTTSDTSKTIPGFLKGKKYFWRIQGIRSDGSAGPWSDYWNFTTLIDMPATPQLESAIPYPNRSDYVTLTWKKAKNASEYLVQLSEVMTFTYGTTSATVSDTMRVFSGLNTGIKYYWRVQAKNVAGSSAWSEVKEFTLGLVSVEEIDLPTEYSLSQNYPNPFNPSTKINFSLPKGGLTKIIIYDSLGNEIETLINQELNAGFHEVNLDVNSTANDLSSGIYFYKIQSGDFTQTKKMILIK